MRNCEAFTPGLKGLKPDVLQTPQPLSKPGSWEAVLPGRPCIQQCCASKELVTELHEQVCLLEQFHDTIGLNSGVHQDNSCSQVLCCLA